MARAPSNKLKPFEKLLTIMVSGNPVTIEEIESTLGNEIYMYRLSTYIWHIKTFANGVVKAIKDGRRVTAYQIVNVSDMKEYLARTTAGKTSYSPGQSQKKPSTAKVAKAAPAPTVKATKPAKSKKVNKPVVTKAAKSEDMEITEVAEVA